jgi:hypothetical protein
MTTERQKLVEWMERNGFDVVQGESVEKLMHKVVMRCAKLAEKTVCDIHTPTGIRIYGFRAGDAIRSEFSFIR